MFQNKSPKGFNWCWGGGEKSIIRNANSTWLTLSSLSLIKHPLFLTIIPCRDFGLHLMLMFIIYTQFVCFLPRCERSYVCFTVTQKLKYMQIKMNDPHLQMLPLNIHHSIISSPLYIFPGRENSPFDQIRIFFTNW